MTHYSYLHSMFMIAGACWECYQELFVHVYTEGVWCVGIKKCSLRFRNAPVTAKLLWKSLVDWRKNNLCKIVAFFVDFAGKKYISRNLLFSNHCFDAYCQCFMFCQYLIKSAEGKADFLCDVGKWQVSASVRKCLDGVSRCLSKICGINM